MRFAPGESCSRLVLTRFGSEENRQLPAQEWAASSRSHATSKDGFVEASPSRVFRDREGMFFFKLCHHARFVRCFFSVRPRRPFLPDCHCRAAKFSMRFSTTRKPSLSSSFRCK